MKESCHSETVHLRLNELVGSFSKVRCMRGSKDWAMLKGIIREITNQSEITTKLSPLFFINLPCFWTTTIFTLPTHLFFFFFPKMPVSKCFKVIYTCTLYFLHPRLFVIFRFSPRPYRGTQSTSVYDLPVKSRTYWPRVFHE